MNRRQITRSALLGSAAALFASSASASSPEAATQALPEDRRFDARQFGAAGDGKTDDTAALQKALDAAGATGGAVLLAPGIYLTGELHLHERTALIGTPAWRYSSSGGSTLRLASPDAYCLLNLTEALGATVDGVALEGGHLGNGVHGIATRRDKWGAHEDGFRIERCQVANFSGDGAHLDCAWCFSVRHSEFYGNHGDGLSLRGWDGFLLDNWFSGNGRAGFAARRENASVTFTANRIEWNAEENMLIDSADGYQITGNFFDRAGTIGLAIRSSRNPANQITITGNFFKRAGKNSSSTPLNSANLQLDGAQGVTCVGNTFQAGRDDGPKGAWGPAYGIIYRGLRNCVVRNNVLHDGATQELLLDQANHHEGVFVSDNPGRLFTDFNRSW
jgi:Pectate lyase superfamily protein